MTGLRPPGVEPPATASDDPRVGHLLGRAVGPESPARAVLVGFPSDEGVRRNGGRPGAAAGPEAIRRRLYGLTPRPRDGARHRRLLERCRDLGDVEVSGRVGEDQERLGRVVTEHLERGAFVLVLGGGHETAYGHYLGHVGAGRAPEILNWDAHPDVRPLVDGEPHSGSPFRQALEHPDAPARGYRVAGLLRHSVSEPHLTYLEERGARWRWGRDLDGDAARALYHGLEAPAMVSFDLDAVDQAWAPGVSAPATGGMRQELWLEVAYGAGRTPAVASADVVELNPRLDVDGRTARLAALTAWRVLAGLADREGPTEGSAP